MKTILSIVILIGLVAGLQALTAEENSAPTSSFIQMKNGQTFPINQFERKDDLLMVAVTTASGGKGQVAYNVSDIAKLNLAEPVELATASNLTANGHADQALALIEPVVAFQQTLRDIPGNWWAKCALAKSSALFALNRGAEASPLLKDIAGSSNDPEIQMAAKLQLALLSPPTDPTQALAAYDTILNQSSDAKTLTQVWIAEGDVYFSQHQFDESLLAYLTVTVFYPDHNPLLPKALWGVAQSYGKLKDRKNEDQTLQDLIANFPDAPETSLAKVEFTKKKNNP